MTVDDRLREAHARIPDPDPATIARARARLTAALDEAPPAPRRTRLRFLLPALALAAAIVVAVVLVTGGGTDLEREVPPAKGTVSYQRDTVVLGTSYVTAKGSINGTPGNAAYAVSWSAPRESWRAPDGSGRVSYGMASKPYLPSAADERAWRAAGSPDLEKLFPRRVSAPKPTTYGPGEFDADRLLNAGLDPKALTGPDPIAGVPTEASGAAAWLNALASRQIEGDGAPPEVVRITVATDAIALLRDARVTPEQRRALIDVLSGLDGARKLASVRDGAGRECPGIELDRETIAYDPRSGELMAEGERIEGVTRWVRTFNIATGDVSAIGERP
jgi:hypothetical protein